jgi:hypothetical protein
MMINNEKFFEELIAYAALLRHGPHRKRNNFDGGIPTHGEAHRQKSDLMSPLLFFFKTRKVD